MTDVESPQTEIVAPNYSDHSIYQLFEYIEGSQFRENLDESPSVLTLLNSISIHPCVLELFSRHNALGTFFNDVMNRLAYVLNIAFEGQDNPYDVASAVYWWILVHAGPQGIGVSHDIIQTKGKNLFWSNILTKECGYYVNHIQDGTV